MARYIDADKMIDGYSTTFPYDLSYCDDGDLMEWLNNQPTADVAPKSEVIRALNEVELLIIITKEMYKQQMEDAPNELSKQSKRTKWVAFEKFYEQFDELKKKYTEGG